MEDFTNANNLYNGFLRARKASGWKSKTQQFGLNLLPNLLKLQTELRDGTYRPEKEMLFTTFEFGKKRTIRAPTVRDIVVQQSLTGTALIPALKPYLIHDNGASLKGKGIAFTRRQFEQHLRWHIRRYGVDGYVLKIDFRHYFDSIDHKKLYEAVEKHLDDDRALLILRTILRDYPEPRGVGIGSVVSQILGIYFPTRIDTYCKTVRRLHCYDAYMDDRIIVHPDKEVLKDVLRGVKRIADDMGLAIHPDKTQITKLSHGFTFLKTRYTITDTGRIIRRIPKDVVARQRRKMKKLARFVRDGDLSLDAFERQYDSWRGGKRYYNAYHTLRNMDKLQKELITCLKKQKRL